DRWRRHNPRRSHKSRRTGHKKPPSGRQNRVGRKGRLSDEGQGPRDGRSYRRGKHLWRDAQGCSSSTRREEEALPRRILRSQTFLFPFLFIPFIVKIYIASAELAHKNARLF